VLEHQAPEVDIGDVDCLVGRVRRHVGQRRDLHDSKERQWVSRRQGMNASKDFRDILQQREEEVLLLEQKWTLELYAK